MYSKSKLDAIYDLRAAVAEKTRAEVAVEHASTPERRDALLQATIKVEDRTQTAIELCHYCGRRHLPDEPHAPGEVIDVDFPQADQGSEAPD
jgi:hypothetical protein